MDMHELCSLATHSPFSRTTIADSMHGDTNT
jgi:hypothetical protein